MILEIIGAILLLHTIPSFFLGRKWVRLSMQKGQLWRCFNYIEHGYYPYRRQICKREKPYKFNAISTTALIFLSSYIAYPMVALYLWSEIGNTGGDTLEKRLTKLGGMSKEEKQQYKIEQLEKRAREREEVIAQLEEKLKVGKS